MRAVMKPFVWLGSLLHWLRRMVLNLVTLAILVGFGFAIFNAIRPPVVLPNSILVVAPKGHLVYSFSQNRWQRYLDVAFERPINETRIRTLTRAIDRASNDPRIRILELDLRAFEGGSVTQLLSVAHALDRFRKSGKAIYAYAPSYSQGSYLLAAHANHVYLNPLGSVDIYGYSDYQPYFKKLLDRIGVVIYAFRKGKYKSAVEPFTRDDMSREARVENVAWLNTWWSTYLGNVAIARRLKKIRIKTYADQLPILIDGVDGNTSQLALNYGLVDKLGSWHDFTRDVAEAVGHHLVDANKISYRAYAAATSRTKRYSAAIAVVPIDGILLDGSLPIPGAVVSGPTVSQLNDLQHDSSVSAIVLQVNSPGGSVDSAERIRDAVLRLRASGKPVVVSMGTLGASGAYLLSTAAQSIYAHRTSITADIGVFALFPNISNALGKIGIGVSGIGTTTISGGLSPLMPLKANVAKALQSHVDYLYERFVSQVAEGRGLSTMKVDAVAQGRAWSGQDAMRLKLVDHLGGVQQAIKAAARLAHLRAGSYAVLYLPRAVQGGWMSTFDRGVIQGLGNLGISNLFPLSAVLAAFQGMDSVELRDAMLLLHAAHPYGYFALAPMTIVKQ